MVFSLAGKSCVVTGASRGIGRAIALAFAAQGADVLLAARGRADLDAVRDQITAGGRRADSDLSKRCSLAPRVICGTLCGT